jgi:hypothetical protein
VAPNDADAERRTRTPKHEVHEASKQEARSKGDAELPLPALRRQAPR